MSAEDDLNSYPIDEYLVALLLNLSKLCEIELKSKEAREFILEEKIPGMDLDTFYEIEPLVSFVRSLRSIANGKDLPWIVILQNLKNRLGKRADFLGQPHNSELPSTIRLIKVMNWFEENPDELDSVGLVATSLLKFCELNAFTKEEQLHCYLYLQALLLHQHCPPCLLSTTDELKDFKSLLFDTEKDPEVRVKELYSMIESHFAHGVGKSEETQENCDNIYSLARKTLFYKDNPKVLYGDPYFLTLKDRYHAMCETMRDTLIRYTTELARMDDDLLYRKSQSHPNWETFKTSFHTHWKAMQTLDSEANDLKESYVFEVQMSAPPGTVWRSQIPRNQFLACIFLMPDSIHQIYTMSCQAQENSERILKSQIAPAQLLYNQSLSLDTESESQLNDWLNFCKSRSQESFLQFLGKIEEEILKAKQKRGQLNA